jgi:OOP family OmpA-OmpF porin
MTLGIEFDTDKADIMAQYHNEIAKLGEYMEKYPTTTTTIEGHTDNVGNNEHNMKLSQQRAESMVDYLVINFGIERSRLSAKVYGSTRPIAYDNTPEGWQFNRRIEAIVDCVLKE